VTVAAVQAAPVHLDLNTSLEKAVRLIAEAAATGATLVVFGETWLPGYPAWLDVCPGVGLWDNPHTKTVFARLMDNAVSIPGDAVSRLGNAARKNKVTLVIGVHERPAQGPGRGTLYNTLLTFTPDGHLVNRHRKLVPTYTERTLWGPGDADGLRSVATPPGRIGGLICWEHWMPLARQALHESGEEIHVAAWPTVKEMHQVASRHYAFEGRCFVIAVGSLMKAADLPGELEPLPELTRSPDSLLLRGGSAIIGPDGAYLVGPEFDRETILTARLELGKIYEESLTLDVTGHYHRPDLFFFQIRTDAVPSPEEESRP
jgi:nitrilase